jgi:hypothetical protein
MIGLKPLGMCLAGGEMKFPEVTMKNDRISILMIPLILFLIFGEVRILYAYDVISVEKGGELSGTITFKGKLPVNQPIKVSLNPEYCGNTVYDETYMVNPQNKGLANVVISIEGVEKGKRADDQPITVDNLKCHFVPHVSAATVGSSYEVRNLDPVLHNYHFRINGKTILNSGMPPKGINIRKQISEAGIIHEACDAHTFMKGVIFVAENPYFAVTDKNGNYSISNIPPGKYKIKIWHEAIPAEEEEIAIPSLKKIHVSMELSIEGENK